MDEEPNNKLYYYFVSYVIIIQEKQAFGAIEIKTGREVDSWDFILYFSDYIQNIKAYSQTPIILNYQLIKIE
jgi:hypothetical protein